MALNAQVSFTWIGHGTWKVRTAGGKDLLLDAFVASNPVAPDALKKVDRLDLMVLTHGHADHVADAAQIAQETGCRILCPYEVGPWLQRQGVAEDNVTVFAKGGTVEVDG